MKLLIVTQKVDKNDDVLGFFHDWIIEFSKNVEKLTVICLQEGEYDLPDNVKVLSLGKEETLSFRAATRNPANKIFRRLVFTINFLKYILSERKNYDAVFVHMNPEYVILGSLVWKFLNKKIGLWYVHKSVDFKLRIAEKIVDEIFSASKESFRLPSEKLNIVGHGIDISKFKPMGGNVSNLILSVGRISPVKNYELLIEVVKILRSQNHHFDVEIAGAPALDSDIRYLEDLKEKIKNSGLEDSFKFSGSIPNRLIPDFYRKGRIFVNFSATGSIDKAVLEAMASGLLVLTSNEAFKKILSEKYFTDPEPSVVADKLVKLMASEPDDSLREYVVNHHDLNNLAEKILNLYETNV